MNEPLLDRIRLLERAKRRWKRAALGLGLVAAVLLALWTGLGIRLLFESMPGLRERVIQSEMEAMMERERADVERQRAETARQKMEAERQRAELEKARAEKALAEAQANQNP